MQRLDSFATLFIQDKAEPDQHLNAPFSDLYMRLALLAAEEVVGKAGMKVVLRDAGLDKYIDQYPPEVNTFNDVTFRDYTNLNTSLLNFFGRSAKGTLLRVGRLSGHYAWEKQKDVFPMPDLFALRVLPIRLQLKLGLLVIQDGWRNLYRATGYDFPLALEERPDSIAYMAPECPMCAGKQANQAICHLYTGSLQEAVALGTGKEFEVTETACRALGDPACVWEISIHPKS